MPASCRRCTITLNSWTSPARRDVARRRREEVDGVVAPVVAEALLDQVAVVEEGLHRHQLDGGDAELHQVVDDARVGEAGEGAAQLLGACRGWRGRHALHMRLVDDRVAPTGVRGGRSSPHVAAVSTTTHFGMTKAESRRSKREVAARASRRGSRSARRASGCRRTAPWRRGRSAACAGLKRWPFCGS